MTESSVADAAGRHRSPATLPGYHGPPTAQRGHALPGRPADGGEIVAVMRHAADGRHGWRVRAMIVVMWRAGLRIQEGLAPAEHDLHHRHLTSHGKRSTVATAAIARELAGFLWAAMTQPAAPRGDHRRA